MEATERDEESPRREPLTRARILGAALALVDREGAGALTMRRLGDDLGVAAMSLYHHVRGREELLDWLSEAMVSEIGADPARDASPRTVLERFARGIRAVALAHPEAFRLVGMRPLRTSAAYRPVEAALGALRALGLPHDEAVHGYRALVAYSRGFALAEIGGFTFEASEDGEDDAPRGVEAEHFPHIAAVSSHLARPDHEAAFAFGMRAVLDGLEASAGRAPTGA